MLSAWGVDGLDARPLVLEAELLPAALLARLLVSGSVGGGLPYTGLVTDGRSTDRRWRCRRRCRLLAPGWSRRPHPPLASQDHLRRQIAAAAAAVQAAAAATAASAAAATAAALPPLPPCPSDPLWPSGLPPAPPALWPPAFPPVPPARTNRTPHRCRRPIPHRRRYPLEVAATNTGATISGASAAAGHDQPRAQASALVPRYRCARRRRRRRPHRRSCSTRHR